MFGYLKGTLAVVESGSVILEVNGVGYRLFVPSRAMDAFPAVGEALQLYTAFVVKEESHSLYGFLSDAERRLFESLMDIAGIGPRMALNLIGHLAFEEMQSAVEKRDFKFLCRVPGVGKKTAERLIIELKDKLPALASLYPPAAPARRVTDPHAQNIQDAILALVHLGYHQNVAQQAIAQSLAEVSEPSDLALLITTALKRISSAH